MAKTTEQSPAKRTANGDRDASGRFVKGNNANPRGRAKLPDNFKDFASKAPERLRAIADDPGTPVKIKADIERWFAEMWYGKAPQAVDLEGKMENTGTTVIEFRGDIAEWAE